MTHEEKEALGCAGATLVVIGGLCLGIFVVHARETVSSILTGAGLIAVLVIPSILWYANVSSRSRAESQYRARDQIADYAEELEDMAADMELRSSEALEEEIEEPEGNGDLDGKGWSDDPEGQREDGWQYVRSEISDLARRLRELADDSETWR